MSEERKEEPIIIKKRRSHEGHGSHGGSWKVAYADFVTAMMAFFIVMWILGQSEQVKKTVVSYFQDPGAFNFVTGKRASPVDLNLVPDKNKGGGDDATKQDGKSKFYFVIPDKDTSNKESRRHGAIIDSIKAAERVKKLEEQIKNILKPDEVSTPQVKELLSSIKIELSKEGLRIELIESKESLFFEIGSARLKPEARKLLLKLSKEIGKLTNYVDIEGHTDSRQFSGNNTYTNWELSADRANSARKVLQENGFWDGQITKVVGYSDRKLMNAGNPFDISNRRVSILVRQLTVDELLNATKQ